MITRRELEKRLLKAELALSDLRRTIDLILITRPDVIAGSDIMGWVFRFDSEILALRRVLDTLSSLEPLIESRAFDALSDDLQSHTGDLEKGIARQSGELNKLTSSGANNPGGGGGGGRGGRKGDRGNQGGGDEEGQDKPGKGGRFWEEYAVRYVGGTFVGGVSLVAMYTMNAGGVSQLWKPFSDLLEKLDHFDSTTALVVAFIGVGFTFSYIASAPIYVLHLFRQRLIAGNKTKVDDKPYVDFSDYISYAFIISAYLCFLAAEIYYSTGGSFLFTTSTEWIVAIGFAVILAMQFCAIGAYITEKDHAKRLFNFYKILAFERAKKKEKHGLVVEYVESYRHLREHANAFMVMIANVFLAVALSLAPSVSSLITMIVLWLLPATFGWFAATMLESQLQRTDWNSDLP